MSIEEKWAALEEAMRWDDSTRSPEALGIQKTTARELALEPLLGLRAKLLANVRTKSSVEYTAINQVLAAVNAQIDAVKAVGGEP